VKREQGWRGSRGGEGAGVEREQGWRGSRGGEGTLSPSYPAVTDRNRNPTPTHCWMHGLKALQGSPALPFPGTLQRTTPRSGVRTIHDYKPQTDLLAPGSGSSRNPARAQNLLAGTSPELLPCHGHQIGHGTPSQAHGTKQQTVQCTVYTKNKSHGPGCCNQSINQGVAHTKRFTQL
jgi:hypothetical protein